MIKQLNQNFFNAHIGEKLLLTLWVGAIWAIGYIAVPTLFGTLDDRQLAGLLAGKMFTAVSYVGLFCGVILMISTIRCAYPLKSNVRFWLLIFMLALVCIGEFILQPQMAELKLLGLVQGSEALNYFDQLHYISSILYMVNSLLGLALVTVHSKTV